MSIIVALGAGDRIGVRAGCGRFASGHHFRHNYIFLHMFKHANSRQLGTLPPPSRQFSPQAALSGCGPSVLRFIPPYILAWANTHTQKHTNDLTCNYVSQFVSCLARLVPCVVSRRLFFCEHSFPCPDVKPGPTMDSRCRRRQEFP